MHKTLKKLLLIGTLVLIAVGMTAPLVAATSPSIDVPTGEPAYVTDSIPDTSGVGGGDPPPPPGEPMPPPIP